MMKAFFASDFALPLISGHPRHDHHRNHDHLHDHHQNDPDHGENVLFYVLVFPRPFWRIFLLKVNRQRAFVKLMTFLTKTQQVINKFCSKCVQDHATYPSLEAFSMSSR